MSKLNLFIPLTKVDEERRLVYGKITEEKLDKAGEIMDYSLSKPNFEAWSSSFEKATAGQSLGNLRVMHGSTVAGKFTKIDFDDTEMAITGVAHVVDDNEWQKVLTGCYTGFSIGGSYGKVTKDAAGIKRYEARPSEVSLVDNPCVHGATFEYAKADGNVELRKFQHELPEGEQPKREPDDQSDPGDENPELKKLEDKAKELCKAAGAEPDEVLVVATDAAPAVLKWHGFVEDARRDLAAPGSVDVNPGVTQLQKWVAADGTQFDTKAEAVNHTNLVKATQTASTIAQPALDALAKATAELDRITGVEVLKPSEAMSAEDKAVLLKAFKLEGDALNDFINQADPAALTAVLGKRTPKDVEPPAVDPVVLTNDERSAALAKGMYAVSRFANILEDLSWLRLSCKDERAMEGDNSTVPEQLDVAIAQLGAVLLSMAQEEVSELSTMGIDPADVCEMEDVLAASHNPKGLIKFIADELKMQPLADGLTKAATRFDADLNDHIQQAHDHMSSATGGMCCGTLDKMAPKDGERFKAVHDKLAELGASCNKDVAKLAKLAPTGDGQGEGDRLTKAEGDALRKMVDDLTGHCTTLAERLVKIERQPAAPKGVTRITKTMDTADEGTTTGDGGSVDRLVKVLGDMPEGERQMALMKAAMQSGRVLAQ